MISATATVSLPTDEQILIEREFDAPRHLVYRAYTEPELIERWWHAGRGRMTSVEIDLRVGGAWRYAMIAAKDGSEVAFHGEFREVVPNERLVTTEVYEMPGAPPPAPEDEPIDIVTFEDLGERSRLTVLIQCSSKEVRDMIVASGMEDGLQDALVLLERVAAGVEA
jgi:uncharacterized protein YndB with AHSA1/START domain